MRSAETLLSDVPLAPPHTTLDIFAQVPNYRAMIARFRRLLALEGRLRHVEETLAETQRRLTDVGLDLDHALAQIEKLRGRVTGHLRKTSPPNDNISDLDELNRLIQEGANVRR